MTATLHHGRWQCVLAGVECDTLICDPPFSRRTTRGHNAASSSGSRDGSSRRAIPYDFMSAQQIAGFVRSWAPRVRGWMAIMTDHVLVPHWERALVRAGRCSFAPLPCIVRGSRARLCGDGPSCVTTHLVVARPRTKAFAGWGSLPGYYYGPAERGRSQHIGGKPVWLMRAIVRDYSRKGDLVCDPFAGTGTTLLAALTENRRGLGSEVDEDTHEVASARLARGYTPSICFGE